eukprot:1141803-Pelagomonas_calceolata.AAC.2
MALRRAAQLKLRLDQTGTVLGLLWAPDESDAFQVLACRGLHLPGIKPASTAHHLRNHARQRTCKCTSGSESQKEQS